MLEKIKEKEIKDYTLADLIWLTFGPANAENVIKKLEDCIKLESDIEEIKEEIMEEYKAIKPNEEIRGLIKSCTTMIFFVFP
ncbi:MAG: hypothetical protein ACFE75_03785 [Candidatus Hodarchaeota archaeon]